MTRTTFARVEIETTRTCQIGQIENQNVTIDLEAGVEVEVRPGEVDILNDDDHQCATMTGSAIDGEMIGIMIDDDDGQWG